MGAYRLSVARLAVSAGLVTTLGGVAFSPAFLLPEEVLAEQAGSSLIASVNEGASESSDVVEVDTAVKLVEAIKTGGSIKVTAAISVNASSVTECGPNTVLDLNGNTVSWSTADSFAIKAFGNSFTLKDGAGNGALRLDAATAGIGVYSDGSIHFESGTIEVCGKTPCAIKISSLALHDISGGKIAFSDDCTAAALYGIDVFQMGAMTVSNVEIGGSSVSDEKTVICINNADTFASVSISSGVYKVNGNAGSKAVGGQKKSVKVTGGQFGKDVSTYVASGYLCSYDGASKLYVVAPLTAQNADVQITSGDGSETFFSSLIDAISAAKDGDEIKLLKSAAVGRTSTIKKNIVLNLNGNKITATAANKGYNAFVVGLGGSLSVEGQGSIEAEGDNRVFNLVGNTSASSSDEAKSANLTIGKDVTITTNNELCCWIAGKGARLDVYGSLVAGGNNSAIQGNGSAGNGGTTVNIEAGSVVKAEQSMAMYLPQAGEVNISGGLVEGKAAIGMKSGSLKVTGGVVHGTLNDAGLDDRYSNTNGIAYDGSAIIIDSFVGYAGNMEIAVSGDAIIMSDYSRAICEIGKEASATNVVSMNIAGGSVIGGDGQDCMRIRDVTAPNVRITGGQFSTNAFGGASIDNTVSIIKREGSAESYMYRVLEKKNLTEGVYLSDPTGFVAPGYEVAKGDGIWTVTKTYVPPVTPPTPSDKTEVEHNQDGSTTTTVTKPDGSQTITHETATGTESVVKKDKDGNVTSTEVSVSKQDAASGKVELPIAGAEPAADASKAPEVGVKVPATVTAEKPVQVTVPVAKEQGAEPDYGIVVYAVDAEGNETVLPKCTVDKDGNVVFQVTGDVTIKVVDAAKEMPDVKESDWFAGDVVDFATARGIVNGVDMPDGTKQFQGYGKTSRGMFVAMLHNLELNPEAASDDSLADVPSDAFYADAAAWALEEGILSGVDMADGSKQFQGNADVTREQVAVFLMRYAQYLGMDTSKRAEVDFPDAGEVSGFAKDAMSWAVAEGLFKGDDATGELNPIDGAARAEVAAVLMRFINLMYA